MTKPSTQLWSTARNHLACVAVIACASCGTDAPGPGPNPDRAATAAEISQWRSARGFVAAGEGEIAEAKRQERKFAKHRAVSPDGKLSVSFTAGEFVGDIDAASTTSTYRLMDAQGRVLMHAPSRLFRHDGITIPNSQRAWFSPDGSKVLVYEYLRESNGPPPFAILFFQNPEHGGEWSIRFPDMGEVLNAPYDEGNHAECRGLLGEEILIRNTHDGVSKIRLDRLKDRHPFPFTVG